MYYANWEPATDIFRSGKRWLIRMELAGVLLPEVQLTVQKEVLTVRGRRRDILMQQGFVCHTLEINYTEFTRSIGFPALIDIDSIKTSYELGILHITLGTL